MQEIIITIHNLLNSLIPLLVALGMVYFVWGIVQYFIGNSEEAKKNGKTRIIYGVIGLTVIVSFWGLVNVLIGTFGFEPTAPGLGEVATECTIGTDFASLVDYVICIINRSVIPLIFALALVTFVFGVIKFFIVDASEEAKRSQGKQFMIWGIIALTVMLSVWGLVSILGTTLDVDTTIIPKTIE